MYVTSQGNKCTKAGSAVVQGGAERLELHKPVYQRLNLGLITFSSALMAVMSVNLELLRPWALVIGSAECSAAATIPAFFYAVTSGHYLQPVQILKARPAFSFTSISITRSFQPDKARCIAACPLNIHPLLS